MELIIFNSSWIYGCDQPDPPAYQFVVLEDIKDEVGPVKVLSFINVPWGHMTHILNLS